MLSQGWYFFYTNTIQCAMKCDDVLYYAQQPV